MSLEWFFRMENGVRLSLPEICGDLEEYSIVFDTDTTLKHPAFILSVEAEDEDFLDFCTIFFDPTNQEFYSFFFDEETELEVKILFEDLNDILSHIEASFLEFLEEFDDLYDLEEFDDIDDLEDFEEDEQYGWDELYDEDDEIFDDEVDWISNDKYLHVDDRTPNDKVEHEIHFKLGRMKDNGEGLLMRNMITNVNGEEYEEHVKLFFKEEEVPYIIDLLEDYLEASE